MTIEIPTYRCSVCRQGFRQSQFSHTEAHQAIRGKPARCRTCEGLNARPCSCCGVPQNEAAFSSEEWTRKLPTCSACLSDPQPTQTCRKCLQDVPFSGYSLTEWKRNAPCCRECKTVETRAWRRKNRTHTTEGVYRQSIKRRFGMELEDYYRMVDEQQGRCASCGEIPEPGNRRALQVDHDHETGEVRALLCSGCNRGLGAFRDDPEKLRKAIAYLERFRAPLM